MYVMKGFSFETIYHMPVYLRNFYFTELVKLKEKEAEELDNTRRAQ